MGGGCWTTTAYANSVTRAGFSTRTTSNGAVVSDDLLKASTQSFYKSRRLANELNPYNVVRECCDSEEHPNTIPVILALDVTGSMGASAMTCAGKLDEIMAKLYKKVTDIEFLMMGIGDLVYDDAPIQASQFESDIRILDQTSKIYFEGGGGGNAWESYTAAWYFGARQTKLDCWKRGKKGIIITLGDERLNPHLPERRLNTTLGCSEQDDVDTAKLYKEVSEKYDIYHIGITDSVSMNYTRGNEGSMIRDSWKNVIGQHYFEGKCDDIPELIEEIVMDSVNGSSKESVVVNTSEGIAW